MEIKIGGVTKLDESGPPPRLSVLLYGPAGVGKTTLACTMPGKKALVSCDPDGFLSVINMPDVDVYDISGNIPHLLKALSKTDPLGVNEAIKSGYDTIIVDSLTMIAEHALTYGIEKHQTAIDDPEWKGYNTRLAYTMFVVKALMTTTADHNKHLCCITHSQLKERQVGKGRNASTIEKRTLAVGGQVPDKLAMLFNEVLVLHKSTDGHRSVLIQPNTNNYELVKTRMFDTMSANSFVWRFNANNFDDPHNMTLAQWYNRWRENKFRKIALPK